jgi:hypothetical protein
LIEFKGELMSRLLAVLIFCCALIGAAQAPASAGAGSRDSNYNKSISGGSSYTGPGDIVSGATAWYGLRAYTAAIAAAGTQKLINIRNTATSETCDVIVATNGGFGNVANCSGSSSGDTVALFCAESAGSCAVTEVYDQTGNGWNVVQATAAKQPALSLNCLKGGTLPCISATAAQNSILATAANFTPSTGSGTMVVVGYTTANEFNDDLISNNGTNRITNSSTASTWVIFSSAGSLTGAATLSILHSAIAVIINSPGTSVLNIDGTETSSTSLTGSTAAGKVHISSTTGASSANVTAEAGFWDTTNFSAPQRANMCGNMAAYWGTTVGAAC